MTNGQCHICRRWPAEQSPLYSVTTCADCATADSDQRPRASQRLARRASAVAAKLMSAFSPHAAKLRDANTVSWHVHCTSAGTDTGAGTGLGARKMTRDDAAAAMILYDQASADDLDILSGACVGPADGKRLKIAVIDDAIGENDPLGAGIFTDIETGRRIVEAAAAIIETRRRELQMRDS